MELADKVRNGRRYGPYAKHPESTEKQIAAGEDRDDTAEDEQADSAYDSACDERSLAGKQNIWNDRNDGPRRKRNKGACGSEPRRSQCCRIQSEFLSRERLEDRKSVV